jgi:hypothetical protein
MNTSNRLEIIDDQLQLADKLEIPIRIIINSDKFMTFWQNMKHQYPYFIPIT